METDNQADVMVLKSPEKKHRGWPKGKPRKPKLVAPAALPQNELSKDLKLLWNSMDITTVRDFMAWCIVELVKREVDYAVESRVSRF